MTIKAPFHLAGLFVAVAIFGLIRRARKRQQLRASMPPGPKLPWFGLGDNSNNIPEHQQWNEFSKWHEQYGPVVSAVVGSTSIIVLGTIEAARDLLEKRGNIYSSRMQDIVGEISSGNMRGIAMAYGTKYRNWRSLIHAGLSIEASKGYKPLQSLEARILLKDLMDENDSGLYLLHIRRFALSVVTTVGYGYRIKTLQDETVMIHTEIDKDIMRGLARNPILVDQWSFLARLPNWLQWWRWEPERIYLRDSTIYTKLLNEVKERIENGNAKPSVAMRGLDKQREFGMNELEIAYASSAPWQAGAITTVLSIQVLILALLVFPEALKKVQEEIDQVVGRDRQPNFGDMEKLPYLQASIKESLRWRPLGPLGVPHSNISADVYQGMYIPKGSKILPNIDLMSRDPVAYPSPDEFKPERFLGPNPAPTFSAAFGFGRRQCPGVHLVQNALFIVAAKIIWAFDIKPRTDPLTGHSVVPDPNDLVGDLVRGPRDVPYELLLRGNPERTMAIILADAEAAENEALEWTA